MKGRILLGALALSLGTIAPAFGQAGPPDGPPDFAEMRQRMEQHLKEVLAASDDEWKVLQPKIEKVREAHRDAGPGGPMGVFFGPAPGGPGGPGGPDGGGPPPPPPPGADANAQPSDVQQKRHDLRDAIESKDAPADEVKAKLQAYRDARAKAKAALAAAQKDLQGVATPKQEAVLVAFGILD